MPRRPAGTLQWMDLTSPHAEELRAFYAAVVGWKSTPLDMGGYEDHCMAPPGGGDPQAGICHARGSNAGQPGGWIPYVMVDDLDASIAEAERLGGEAATAVRGDAATGRFAVIRDPHGNTLALYEDPGPVELAKEEGERTG
ncbi:MAG: VOC family protein [Candidatus Sumerlaeia bacterium]|nr:VOC family protein [Candidatus Sumerlaeia bacterium]